MNHRHNNVRALRREEAPPPKNKLLRWRIGNGLTQQQAAERLGIRQAVLSKYERDEVAPSHATAVKIDRLTGGEVPHTSWLPSDPHAEPVVDRSVAQADADPEVPVIQAAAK